MNNRIRALRLSKGLKQSDLAGILGIRQNTLSTWETGKYEPDNESLQNIADFFGVTVDYVIGRADTLPRRKGARIPVLGQVAAGIPIEAIQDILDYEEIDEELARTGEFFGLRIKGRSMEPRMLEGDVVIVRRQETAETGDTVVVSVNGDLAAVKKIKIGPAGVTLLPTNPSYDPLFFTCDEVEQLPVRIIGKVVELRAKY
ncbi:MAG: helix-turn-helix domain-containing protein [Clostridia bacterium]|nr:helix-turn-helix domain-containing protein [Clostridia bacterium]